MSLAVLDRRPIRWRWWALRRCSGPRSGVTPSISRGTPISTTRPSVTEVWSRITETTTNETTAPAKRADTSMTWPMWERSLVPMATTSPVETLRGRVPPRRVAWRVTSWTTRYAAISQFVTAKRCRMMPATAWTSPMPNSTAAHWTSCSRSFAATPSSIAWPMTAGITAWAHIQTMPKNIPPARVGHCLRAIHQRKAPGVRVSATPGWSRGSLRTRPTVRTEPLRQRIVFAVTGVTRRRTPCRGIRRTPWRSRSRSSRRGCSSAA